VGCACGAVCGKCSVCVIGRGRVGCRGRCGGASEGKAQARGAVCEVCSGVRTAEGWCVHARDAEGRRARSVCCARVY